MSIRTPSKDGYLDGYHDGVAVAVADTEARYKPLVEVAQELDRNMGNLPTAGWVRLRAIIAALKPVLSNAEGEAPDA